MRYCDLMSKKCFISGSGKIGHDIETFFSELKIAGYVEEYPEKMFRGGRRIFSADAYAKKAKDNSVCVICHENPEKGAEAFAAKGLERGKHYIFWTDLLPIVDEKDTFRADCKAKGREIVVIGGKERSDQLMNENPNLRVSRLINTVDPQNAGGGG